MDNPTIIVRTTGGPERLELIDAPMPVAGPGQLLVRVEACGVAFADIVMRMGFYPGVKVPFTPGYEVVGIVISGDGFAPGTRVAALTVNGGYARHAVIRADHAVAVPDGLSSAKAAALVLNGLTAWQMLTRTLAQPSVEKMLVWGASGGVGSILVDLGRHFGIETYGVTSGGRGAFVAARGGIPVDRSAGDVAEQVKRLSGGGVDAVFDGVGGSNVKISQAALRDGGAVIVFGFQGALGGAKFSPLKMLKGFITSPRISLLSLFQSGLGVRAYIVTQWQDVHPAFTRADLAELFRLGAAGIIDPAIHAEWPLERAAEAQQLMMGGGQTGKIILLP
ncbi:MAG: zinc-binding dehydrogenase [Sandarakinorhabdus sp.]|nr:zinc-binding dehydrogenase [Sandarakinorhabdus sp.]